LRLSANNDDLFKETLDPKQQESLRTRMIVAAKQHQSTSCTPKFLLAIGGYEFVATRSGV
jgi:hypothetical protein